MNALRPLADIDPSRGTSKNPVLLSAAFNQDQGCFSVGYEHGFRVYSTDPMEQRVKREFNDGGIAIAQMLHRTNYLALVGGGRNPKFPQNKVIIWDDLKHRPAISLEQLSTVLNVLLSRTRIIVVLQSKVHVYNFSSPPNRIATYETADNPLGIATLSNSILAFPGRTEGQIQIVDLSPGGQERNLVSIIRAHRGAVRSLALSNDGSYLASASENGTLIRIHATINTALVHEFRRGLDRALVHSMTFSPSNTRLAVLSDKGTLHVFDTSTFRSHNRRHVFGKIPLLPKYFSSEWSFVSVRVQQHADNAAGGLGSRNRGVIGWSSDDSIIVIWIVEGKWEKYVIVEKEERTFKTSDNGGASIDQDLYETGAVNGNNEDTKWELIRESWRGFDDIL